MRISEAPSFGKPVVYYDKSSRGAEAYEMFTEELLKRHKAAEKALAASKNNERGRSCSAWDN